MVFLTISERRLAHLRLIGPFAPDDEIRYLALLEDLARQPAPFALMVEFIGRIGFSQTAEREQALWFKRTRAWMNDHCRALVIVRPDARKDTAAVFGRLWSFPVFATVDGAEGQALIAPYLDPAP